MWLNPFYVKEALVMFRLEGQHNLQGLPSNGSAFSPALSLLAVENKWVVTRHCITGARIIIKPGDCWFYRFIRWESMVTMVPGDSTGGGIL